MIEWINSLDKHTKSRIQSRLTRLLENNFGDHKKIDNEISELRLKFGAGYRIYYTEINKIVVLLINGGDKKTQTKDIDKQKLCLKYGEFKMKEFKNTLDLENYIVEDLKSDEEIKLYLNTSLKDYLEDGDFNSFYRALEIAIRAKYSISGFAKKIGMSRTHLYSLFKSEKEPKFSTVIKIFHELGYDIEVA